jgi:hypothetical protein
MHRARLVATIEARDFMQTVTHWKTRVAAATLLIAGVCGISAPARIAAPHASANRADVPSIALPMIRRSFLRPPARVGPSRLQRAPLTAQFVYTAQHYGDDVSIYQQNSNLSLTFQTTLTDDLAGPQGTMATVNGIWYVANTGDSNILVYKSTNQGPVGPKTMLDDAGQYPGNVYATVNGRLVAVSNASSTSGGTGSVSIYLDRLTEPARTLFYDTDDLEGEGIAIDRHGNCFWSFNDLTTGGGSIVEFAGCDGNGVLVRSGLGFAGGLAFDQKGNLYYVDQTAGISKCSGVSGCSALVSGFGDPVNINFDFHFKDLWVADATGYIDAVDPIHGQIEYSRPAIGGPTDPPFGIAAAPGGGR